MFEYSSVRSSSWDTDNLVTQLNVYAADGWRVVGIVNTGSDVAALLERTATAGSSAAGVTDLADVGSVVVVDEAVADVAPDTIDPVDTTAETVEPAGWADAPASTEPAPAEPAAAAAEPVTAAEPAAASTEPVSPIDTAAPAAAASSGAAGSSIPANWYPDPSGRYELRYWDGQQWTEHVARGGQRFSDPPVA